MFIASRPDGQRCMLVQRARQILIGLVTTALFALGAVPIHVSAAASKPEASAIAALDAIPAADWLKLSSSALLDRVIAASSKASLDAAAARDPRAQALVGSAHLSGLHGYEKSEAKAVTFYRLAADSNPIAQNNLGNLLLSGAANGGTPAPAEAAEMFRRAAKQGHPVGQANIARLHIDGVGVEKDLAKAKEFLALAAAQGNAEAKTSLDTLVAREAADLEAEKWKRLEAAAATGDADAVRKLAEAYEEIARKALDAIKSNQLQLAVNIILKARDSKKVPIAEVADEHGMTALHWVVTNRNAAGLRWLLDKRVELEAKDDQGRTPLKIALDNVDARSMTILIDRGAKTSTALPGHDKQLGALKITKDIVGVMIRLVGVSYHDGKGVAKDQAKSASIFAVGCEAGDAYSCHNLGTQYGTGVGVAKDTAKAATLYQKACDGNVAASCGVLGSFYYLGEGVPKDWAKAAAYNERACNGGVAVSCRALSLLYGAGEGVALDKAKAEALLTKACQLGEQKACKPAVAAAPAAPSAAAPAAAQPGAGACKFGKVALGVDTIASVERDIQARGGTPSVGSNGNYRRINTLSGDYSDVLPDGFMAVNHDFDMGTASGRLVVVTVAKHALSAPEFERLLANRKAAIGKSVGPIQQTAMSPDQVFQAASAHCRAKLVANAQTWWIYEIYELPK